MTGRSAAGWLMLVCVALALTPGCLCSGEDKTETVAQLESPIAVRLIQEVKWKRGHGPLTIFKEPFHKAWLAFDAGFEHPLRCGEALAKLFVDEAGERIALRCANGRPWMQIFVGKSRALSSWHSDLGKGAEPDWSKALSIEDAVLGAVAPDTNWGCDEEGAYQVLEELRGTSAFATLLPRLAAVQGCRSSGAGQQPWDKAFDALSAEQQDQVRAPLEQDFLAGEVRHWLLRRIVHALPLGRRPIAERTAAQARAILDDMIAKPTSMADEREWTLVRVLRRLTPAAPAPAGALACHALQVKFRAPLRAAAHAVVAHTKTSCDWLQEELKSDPTCKAYLKASCGREGSTHLCTPEELAPVVADWLFPDPKARRSEITDRRSKLGLAAAYAQGELPCR